VALPQKPVIGAGVDMQKGGQEALEKKDAIIFCVPGGYGVGVGSIEPEFSFAKQLDAGLYCLGIIKFTLMVGNLL
jgi:hypothetical protein